VEEFWERLALGRYNSGKGAARLLDLYERLLGEAQHNAELQ